MEKYSAKNIVNVLSLNFKNLIKISYYTVTIDVLYYEKYLAVTSFAILLILYCYFCAFIVSAVLFMSMKLYRQYIYTKQIELFYFWFFIFIFYFYFFIFLIYLFF